MLEILIIGSVVVFECLGVWIAIKGVGDEV